MQPQSKRPSENDLRALYLDQRLTTRAIGERFGVAHITIRRWLGLHGIPVRPQGRGLNTRGETPPSPELLYHLIHVAHLSYGAVGERYGVDPSAVKYWLTKLGIPHPTAWGTRYQGNPPRLPDVSTFRRLYTDEGQSLRQLGRTFGATHRTISRYCTEHGIPLRHDDGWDGGNHRLCTDGHRVRSVYEQRVDDWLSLRHIDHLYEPRLPFDHRFKADFLAGGWYIEVWGVTGNAAYTERRNRKSALYALHHAPLIQLPAHSFERSHRNLWERRLLAKLAHTSARSLASQLALPS